MLDWYLFFVAFGIIGVTCVVAIYILSWVLCCAHFSYRREDE